MTPEERLTRMEAAFGSQSDLMRELRDAVTVTAEMEAMQSRALKEHTRWLVAHDKAIQEHDERMKSLNVESPAW